MTVTALILAAGEGTRMKSGKPKVAHEVLGLPMIRYVVDAAVRGGCGRILTVTGHKAEEVEAIVGDVSGFVRQEHQLGTGHAVMCAREAVSESGALIVLSGDIPLIRPETIRKLAEARESAGAAVALLTARMKDPLGYGRIVRDDAGGVRAIIEEKDCTPEQRMTDEVNTGIYCFDAASLLAHLNELSTANTQGEYYLTDMVGVFRAHGLGITAVQAADVIEVMGVNTRLQLAQVTKALQQRINHGLMLEGVTMIDPDLVWVGPEVSVGCDVEIWPMTTLLGKTIVGDGAVLGPGVRATDSVIKEGARVDASVLIGAEVGVDASVGPVAYLRPGAVLEAEAKAGTCVEIKNSTIGRGSKVSHLSYVGDATVGTGVNIGAGTITCNYDGLTKHPTMIGDGAFVGSDTMFVAPVKVGAGALIGAGSVITRDVPDGALALERAEQKIIEGWVARRRAGSGGRS
ncbi:MAG: bifunctional UDP-N-acetylglucosamine diphosphorylase/glucosamine-1-phosphate N-acetyltransferase GlmU [Coriobacteriia bacterium]|nr:bifunctional UDP-N-acetylglucosamine diphosphorylase/glucosamine-1-phosphate N-acetyltransferase GlmU [Coriobacteriia bacterium]